MKKVWVAIVSLQISILLLFLATLSQAQQVRTLNSSTKTTVLPVKGEKGDPGQIDKAELRQMVTDEVNNQRMVVQGPAGQQGQPGQSIQGPAGVNGIDGKDGATPVKGVDYQDGLTLVITQPRQDVEQRINPHTNETEWRCAGDTLWTLLRVTPLLTGSCL